MLKRIFMIPASLFLVVLFISPAISQQEDFLVGYWAFEEGKGNNARDQSGKNNDGKINGDVKWVNGKIGKALEFSPGANVKIPDSDSLRSMNEYTIAMWVELHDFAPAWNHLFEKDGSYGLTVNVGTGDFRYTPNSSKIWIESKHKVKKDTWYYITMSCNGPDISFYVNGQKVSEANEPIVFNNNPINIAHPAPYTVDGVIDEVKFWAKALTPPEINIAMKGGAAVKASEDKLTTTWACIKSL